LNKTGKVASSRRLVSQLPQEYERQGPGFDLMLIELIHQLTQKIKRRKTSSRKNNKRKRRVIHLVHPLRFSSHGLMTG